ncbi:MAG: hypothetical protein ACFKPT_25200 [Gloeotrichia echinulata GP01]
MGMIGDLLYPDNPDLAREANDDQQKLEKIHTLHNQMVTIYRGLAEDIRTFDSYLMGVLVLQYHLVYTQEDLENLPDTKVPQMTKSLADKIEGIGIDALSIKMAYNGLKAIYNRIANAYQESGSYRANMEGGELSEDGAANLAEDLAPQIDSIAAQSDIVSSANIDLLTNTELSQAEMTSYVGELGETAESVSTASEATEVGESASDLGEVAEGAETGIEAAAEAIDGAEAATEVAAEVGIEGVVASATAGAAALLGPAIIIVIVVTAIFEVIEAGEMHEKLEEALTRLRKMIEQSEKSLASLKKATKSLLLSGKSDIIAYNKLLERLYQLEKNPTYNQSFKVDGFDSFINALDNITIDNPGGLDGYKAAVVENLSPAKDFISKQAKNDSSMTEAISMIRTKVANEGEGSITQDYLDEVVIVLALNKEQVTEYNRLRVV